MVLVSRVDHVVTRPEIFARVWGGEMTHRDRSVDVFVRKLRGKLAEAAPGTEAAPGWVYIHTHFGAGYRLSPQPAAPVS